jgi:beta-aspartyl-peptidase (threonine type)
MKRTSVLLAMLAVGCSATSAATPARTIALVIHGGAGTMPRAEMTAEREAQYREGLGSALDAGYAVLDTGGTALDAVSTVVRLLEDNPLFNAGKGAVLTHDGYAELDASIMDGRELRAGAVTGLRHIQHPIDLARAVMEKSPHVMLSGTGAEEFALTRGFAMLPNSWFETPARRSQLEKELQGRRERAYDPPALGTVGAVALDRNGNLAAATSTGGMTNKRYGRIGDSPIIGAGTYANNSSCAVSATGSGEYFIRSVVAHDVCALVQYRGWPLAKAAQEVVQRKLVAMGGDGGIIALDPAGNVAMEFNSEGMFRGVRTGNGRREIAIYRLP